jgi:hypothetical protein
MCDRDGHQEGDGYPFDDAAGPLGRAQAVDRWGQEQMARGLNQLDRASSTCIANAVGVHVYEELYMTRGRSVR